MESTSPSSVTTENTSDRLKAVRESLRQTYLRQWRDPRYSERSPAVHAKTDILRELGVLVPSALTWPSESLLGGGWPRVADVGCGTGRMLPLLFEAGYAPDGIDLVAHTSMDPDVLKDFGCWEVCMGDIPEGMVPRCDAAICIDVMEHVPVEMEEAFLEGVVSIVAKGGVFGISLNANPPNHCNIKTADEWEALLRRHWFRVARAEMTFPELGMQNYDNWILFTCAKE